MLGGELGYGEEISLLGEGGKLLYDIDFDDLLDRSVKEIGLVEGRTLTVVDEESERVNVEFIITENTEFQVPKVGNIPKKPTPKEVENGEKADNGVAKNGVEKGVDRGKKRAREDDFDDGEFRKRARVGEEGDVILIDEDDDTVMID
jgi:ubiquitin-like 1-activating enzyme E1 B